jgi:hypothetical protein
MTGIRVGLAGSEVALDLFLGRPFCCDGDNAAMWFIVELEELRRGRWSDGFAEAEQDRCVGRKGTIRGETRGILAIGQSGSGFFLLRVNGSREKGDRDGECQQAEDGET